ncbi:hypothetical protein BDV27DRAFT_160622 [Aspergillus caelatus]|uniref:Uncharacterized protein n=1 Tax=Aspergillus caelatus TaxID=61420 RepID=A0A5N6ZW75_9EURO|nr:uncharacterized protein BDV27DRAFT_160622 [Aspergillus caelatus]KAE8361523.1 hypothetical protein BDV27DRAFT_160622 [Aspergillus caelatus]
MSATLYPLETNDRRVTSWLPLTTAWPLPSGCSTSFRISGPALIAFDPEYSLERDPYVGCALPEIRASWQQAALEHPDTSISLGPLTCPDYLYTVATSVRDGSSTLAMCCPSEYIRENGIPNSKLDGDCLSAVASNMVLTFGSSASENPGVWTMVTTTLLTSSTVRAIAVMGWNIEISVPGISITSTAVAPTTTTADTFSMNAPLKGISNMIMPSSVITSRSEDLSILASLTPIPVSSTTLTAPSWTFSRSITDYGLSPEDKAGIGVGAGVVAIGLGVLVVAICILVRKQRRSLMRRPPPPHSL